MRAVPRPASLIAVTLAWLLAGALGGCATRPPASNPEALQEYEQTNDPLEPTNRFFYRVDNGIDAAIVKPVAEAYRYAVPAPVRGGVHNALGNLSDPVVFANDILQAKPRRAGDTFMRFLINSTVGVGGLLDVATGLGYPKHDTDFGITLALWGVPSGPFLFLPVLGPSDPRDFVGFGADIAMDPFSWIGMSGAAICLPGQPNLACNLEWARFGMEVVDERERVLGEISQIKKTALDPYATFRSLYRQHRQSEIEATRNDKRATVPDWFPQPPAAANEAAPKPPIGPYGETPK